MENFELKTEKGGYDKKDVLAKIDAYNVLLIALDEMRMSDAAVNAELEKIRSMPLRKAKGLIFAGSGFAVRDTEDYLVSLEKQVLQRIML